MMKHIISYLRSRLFTGMVVILPIGITLWIFTRMFNAVDSILGSFIYGLLGRRIPGLGILLTFILVILVGVFTGHYIGKWVMGKVETLLMRIPIIKTIYGPIKDVFGTLTKKDSSNFKKAVLVTYPMEGIQSIGFITKDKVVIDGVEKTVVFIPTTPNPTSGFLVYLPRSKYIELDIPVDVALKTIVSLGTISPDIIKKSAFKDVH